MNLLDYYNSFTKNFKTFRKWNHPLSIAIIILTIIILSLIASFGTPFFRDFAIIHEGAYRIMLGQTPYVDFYLTIGPIVFYLQAFFNLIFGPTILAMSVHVITLSTILTMLFYFTIRKEFNFILRILLSVGFYISYYGLIGFPWYNQTAFFFLFLNLFLILLVKDNYYLFPLSSILAILSFFSKQDIGIYHFIFIGLFFTINSKKRWQLLHSYAVPFILLLIAINTYFNRENGFLGSFASQAGSRILNFFNPMFLLKLIPHIYLYIAILAIILLFFETNQKNKKLISLIAVVTIIPLLTSATSGLMFQSLITAFPLVLLLLYRFSIRKFQISKFKPIIHIIIFLILLLGVYSYHYARYDEVSESVLTRYSRALFQLTQPGIPGPELHSRFETGCLAGGTLHNNNDLTRIKQLITSNNNDFFNMAEYTYLYCDLQIEPPKNIPLWFHYKVTFFDTKMITDFIEETKPKLIILPLVENQADLSYQLVNEFELLGYKPIWETSKINYYHTLKVLQRKD